MREDLWWRARPSGASVALSFRGGAVTGRVGSEVDQKGNNILRSLCRNEPDY
jgi:hypothetical protein